MDSWGLLTILVNWSPLYFYCQGVHIYPLGRLYLEGWTTEAPHFKGLFTEFTWEGQLKNTIYIKRFFLDPCGILYCHGSVQIYPPVTVTA